MTPNQISFKKSFSMRSKLSAAYKGHQLSKKTYLEALLHNCNVLS